MSAADGYIIGADRQVYMKNDFATDSPTWAELTNASDGIILDANVVKGVDSCGPFGAEGSQSSFFVLGSSEAVTRAGGSTRGTATLSLYVDHSDAHHVTLRDLSVGDAIRLATVAKTDTDELTATYVKGEVASREFQPAEAGTDSWDKLELGITLVQKEVYVNEA